ncbi:MAG TPA: radical SAM protein [Euryarchaeota archaeon]|nr:radical SAM protein [Euryarchaeota archaeon]
MRVKSWLNGSAYTVRLPIGCRHCARGGKLVLLVTGRCDSGCYYCPLSLEKRGRDLVFADEMKVESDEDIFEEAESIDATGTGITGGDPLKDASETARLIRLLKDRLGDGHHIHLYTSTADSSSIDIVIRAGLDEIRFHPPMRSWSRLENGPFERVFRLCSDSGLDVGMEIPVIPGMKKETMHLLEYAECAGLSFVNLNELEFSESNWRALRKRGLGVRDDVSSAVKGSERLAIELIRDGPRNVPIHYCSSSFKDGVQLRRRIMRRARNVRRALDILTEDGTLLFGVIEGSDPEFVAEELKKRYPVPRYLLSVNRVKNRVEIASWILEEIGAELEWDSFIIEEYPTADRLEVERERILRRR